MNIRWNTRDLPAVSEQSKPTALHRLIRMLVEILSSPKGNQGGWEGGARGL
jgi:hypothetical protein